MLTSSADGDKDHRFQLNIANSVWGQQEHGFLQDFLDTLAENYGEKVREVEFKRDPEQARIDINNWVYEETEERIKNLIPPDAIDRYTRLVLANAIYFNAAWQNAFNEAATTPRPFNRLNGNEVDVPMMRQQARFGYAQGDGFQALELPYEGGDIAMTILLPDSGNFTGFEDSIVPGSLESITQDFETRLLRLTMPKFEMESSFSLSRHARRIGDGQCF